MSFRIGALTMPLVALTAACAATPAPVQTAAASPAALAPISEAAFSEELTERTFRYFWDTTDTQRCLAPDRWPSNPFSSIAATGFALTAYGIGAERGYVTRAEAASRTRDCLRFYWDAPQGPDAVGMTGHKGFFYHFLNNEDGTRRGNTELSTVDTALLLGGVLFAQSYYDADTPVEAEIRDLAEKIYARVDWTFVQREKSRIPSANGGGQKAIAMGWYPERGDRGDFGTHDWVGYNEGMLVYILAMGSPTHPVGKDAWDQGWAADLEKDWGSYYGQQHLQFEPLFGHQYSHVWVDFRGIRDAFMRGKGIDYFENSRRATLAQRAYGVDNPNKWTGYGADIWGWTASDGPGYSQGKYSVNGSSRSFNGYMARGASAIRVVDDGTVVPTAAGGSVPFAPEVTIPALMAMRAQYGTRLYTRYGFKDAFNPSFTFTDAGSRSGAVDPAYGWVANDYLGIDQGPILAMMENHRSGFVWKVMRKNPHITRGLKRIGFEGGWLEKAAD
ncbi:glucoamylase family protein [Sphingopyxis sp. RIFCSPHIGHO2_12_FULL_65_19]|uniref:glucoamylase family protein n=1 Tax=Sphingopyxis sp. RIFCSPHIGHO2_12_FULL_65_19 TaxID=1802172 RepID=UPI0008D1BC09|nr:glucoamylase family protein [Sphingopyxis sp. RIFCSPHIGHO2_12_FULL_65_19]OHD05800.1 MAG: Tat pathway signal protein [Sphingopyxis sp. RIFCSPHIGHO2_12_FULL_65_19]